MYEIPLTVSKPQLFTLFIRSTIVTSPSPLTTISTPGKCFNILSAMPLTPGPPNIIIFSGCMSFNFCTAGRTVNSEEHKQLIDIILLETSNKKFKNKLESMDFSILNN